jgi:hypothetical protein
MTAVVINDTMVVFVMNVTSVPAIATMVVMVSNVSTVVAKITNVYCLQWLRKCP